MASYVGAKILLKAKDGTYEGTINSMDEKNSRISLSDVRMQNGASLHGILHFFGHEMEDIQILEQPNRGKTVGERGQGPLLMKRKLMPSHIKHLKDVNRSSLYLRDQHKKLTTSGSSDDDNQGEKLFTRKKRINVKAVDKSQLTLKDQSRVVDSPVVDVPKSTKDYSIIDDMGDTYKKAIDFIGRQNYIGLSLQGTDINRNGKLCWLQIGCPDHVFLFDMLRLQTDGFPNELKKILESSSCQKVIHDCRFISDMLYNQYKIQLVNVFDTQVASVMVYKIYHGGDLPRYVSSLSNCLFEYMDLHENQVYIPRIREASKKEDLAVWAERPVSQVIVDAAVKNCCYLLRLRSILQRKMLMDFIDGVDIYLSIIRDCDESALTDKVNMGHTLPTEFKNLRSCAEEKRRRFLRLHKDDNELYDEHGFIENVPAVNDPVVNYRHDGIWHQASGITRNISPDPISISMRRRGRTRSRSLNRLSEGRSETIKELGSSKIREAQCDPPRIIKDALIGACSEDLKSVINTSYIKDQVMVNVNQETDSQQQSVINGFEEEQDYGPKLTVFPAGLESSSGNVPKKEAEKLVYDGVKINGGNYTSNGCELYEAIPDSKHRISERDAHTVPLFTEINKPEVNTRKSRLPKSALTTSKPVPNGVSDISSKNSAFARVADMKASGDSNKSFDDNNQSFSAREAELQMKHKADAVASKLLLTTLGSDSPTYKKSQAALEQYRSSIGSLGRGQALSKLIQENKNGLNKNQSCNTNKHNLQHCRKSVEQFEDSEDDLSPVSVKYKYSSDVGSGDNMQCSVSGISPLSQNRNSQVLSNGTISPAHKPLGLGRAAVIKHFTQLHGV